MKRSFTLIEVLVSITIFSLVILGVVGIMLNALKVRRMALQKSYLYDTGRFIMESISREFRVSTDLIFSPYQITFNNPDLGEISYLIDNNAHTITRNGEPIIPQNIKVTGEFFTIYDGQEGFFPQPMITIVLNLSDQQGIYKVNLQTAVSQRLLNTTSQ